MFLFYQSKYKEINIGSFLLFIWIISSICGALYELNPIFSHYNSIALCGMLYLFILNYFLFRPVLRIPFQDVTGIVCNIGAVCWLALFILVLSIFPLIENIKFILTSGGGASINNDLIQDRYNDASETYHYMTSMSVICTKCSKSLGIVALVLIFHSLTLKGRLMKVVFIASFVCILNQFVEAFCVGSRVTIAINGLVLIFIYILYRPYIEIIILKRIKAIALICIIPVIIGFAFITITRYNDLPFTGRTLLSQWVLQYAGESHGNFGADAWSLDYRNYGNDIVSNVFKQVFLGIDYDREGTLARNPFPDDCKNVQFYTVVGTFFIPYGAFWTLIMVLTVSWFCSSHFKLKRIVSLSKIIMIVFYSKILLLGFTYFCYAFDNWQMVSTPIAAFILMIFEKANSREIVVKR